MIEAKRGCGYRKVGGVYIVSSVGANVCDKLPIPLVVCPVCGQGIKVRRNVTGFEPFKFFGGDHKVAGINICLDRFPELCNICTPPQGKHYLLPVGKHFYPTPMDFIKESLEQGISKRLPLIPKDFKLGETVIYLVHDLAVKNPDGTFSVGIFSAFKPERIEKLIWQKDATEDILKKIEAKGWTPVVVPDGDLDHAPTRNYADELLKKFNKTGGI